GPGPAPGSAAPRAAEGSAAGAAGRARTEQRVFVKITADAEKPELLTQLKRLLQEHPGPVATVLFYERSQKVLALSEAYRIKPSPELFGHIERMFGADTVKVR
ncbi:hypothetical protein, partial [Paenibacillus campinasensis]